MTVVRECPVCHHTGLAHVGVVVDKRFKQASNLCQTPVRIPLPNQPGASMGVPCGCDGTGPATPKVEETPPPPPPKCFNPGCQEFATSGSSFCSTTCQDEMANLISSLSKGN